MTMFGPWAASIFSLACADASPPDPATTTNNRSHLVSEDDGEGTADSDDESSDDESSADETSPNPDSASDSPDGGTDPNGGSDDTSKPIDSSEPMRAAELGPTTPIGSLVPLYIYPSGDAWRPLIRAKQNHPNVEMVAVVNPGNGPGKARDPSYTTGIQSLTDAGIVPIGYVSTDHGNVPAETVRNDITTWRTFYPAVRGIFFDEQDNKESTVGYYRDLAAYAKSNGNVLTVGNPGTMWTPPGYFDALDVVLIYEKDGMPDPAEMQDKLSNMARTQCAMTPYAVSMLDPMQVQAASKWVKYIYVSDRPLKPNPWIALPGYLDALYDALDPPSDPARTAQAAE